MDEVPDGDWFCTICEHDKLIKALEEKTELIENHFKEIELAKTKSIVKRTNRIADIGANLDNLFKSSFKIFNEFNPPNVYMIIRYLINLLHFRDNFNLLVMRNMHDVFCDY